MLLPLWHILCFLWDIQVLKWKKWDNQFYLLKSKVTLFLFFKWNKSKFLLQKNFVKTVWTATESEKYWTSGYSVNQTIISFHLARLDWATLFWWADFLNVWEIMIYFAAVSKKHLSLLPSTKVQGSVGPCSKHQ